jgi:hypothetical protein
LYLEESPTLDSNKLELIPRSGLEKWAHNSEKIGISTSFSSSGPTRGELAFGCTSLELRAILNFLKVFENPYSKSSSCSLDREAYTVTPFLA